MNYDDVLPYLSKGNFGKYQKKIYILLCLPSILCAFIKLAGVFLLAVPEHRCRLEGENANASFSLSSDIWNASIPFDEKKGKFSQCELINQTTKAIVECDKYIWNTTKTSAVMSFSLVCDRGALRASADSFMMVGVLIGSYVFGDLSVRYWRRPTFMFSLLIQVVFGLLTAISPDFISYTICRMVR